MGPKEPADAKYRLPTLLERERGMNLGSLRGYADAYEEPLDRDRDRQTDRQRDRERESH